MPLFMVLVLSLGAWFVGTNFLWSAAPAVLVATSTPPHTVPAPVPAMSDVAGAYIVVRIDTGEVLAAHHPDTPRPLASITKLFTAAALTLPTATTTIMASDVAMLGEAGGLAVGQVYTLHELLFPLLLTSSNDAAAALFRQQGDAILARMTATESALTFADVSGLSPENKATAAALAAAVRRLFMTERHLFDITTLPTYTTPYHSFRNNNPAAALPGFLGGKHGYTEAAGKTVAAVYEEVLFGRPEPVLYVLLDTPDIASGLTALRAAVATAHTVPAI